MMERRVVAVIVPVIGHRYHVDGRVENPLAVELMFHQLPEETSRLLPSGTFHNLRNATGPAGQCQHQQSRWLLLPQSGEANLGNQPPLQKVRLARETLAIWARRGEARREARRS